MGSSLDTILLYVSIFVSFLPLYLSSFPSSFFLTLYLSSFPLSFFHTLCLSSFPPSFFLPLCLSPFPSSFFLTLCLSSFPSSFFLTLCLSFYFPLSFFLYHALSLSVVAYSFLSPYISLYFSVILVTLSVLSWYSTFSRSSVISPSLPTSPPLFSTSIANQTGHAVDEFSGVLFN